MNGIIMLFVYAAIMILATVTMTKKEKNVVNFCVGSRSENWILSALSIAATWIWAPALFVSTEKAYSAGWIGLFWFLVPNALCLVIFIPFAKRIRKEMPEGMTLSGYMKEKYKSDGVKRVYLFQLIGLSVLSTGVQLLAGSQILSAVTGISFKAMTILLACIAISYSLFSGIKASMLTDAIQMVFMLVACSLFVIFGVRNTGTQGIIQGLSGISGDYTTLFSGKGVEIFLAFGLPTTIGLLSGPFGDQSFWQRAFAVKKEKLGRAFLLGAVLFAVVPLSTLRWVDRNLLKPNDYNPNKVSKENLKLLIQSILTNGWTLPIVVRPDMTIIDGFHRWTVAGMEPLLSKLDGKVPIVIVEHKEHSEDIYGTVTHNRARGTHLLEPMKKIVKELMDEGKTVEEIGKQLGMRPEEIFRLSDFSKEDFLKMMTKGVTGYSKAEFITKI